MNLKSFYFKMNENKKILDLKSFLSFLDDLLDETIFFSLEIILFIIPGIYITYIGFKKNVNRYKILGIYLIFIFVLIEVFKYHIVDYIQNGNGYRLGDMVINKGARNQINGKNYHFKFFPNSIVSEYMRKTQKNEDYETLFKIIKNRNNEQSSDDTLVIHLRTGDVVNKSLFTVDYLLNCKHSVSKYIKNYHFYENLNLEKINIKKVILVSSITSGGGSRNKDNTNKSYEYIEKIKKFFEEKNYNVEKKLNGNPDEDFIYMCNSKFFVPSGGGFSKIIKNIVLMNKNKVFE